MGMFEADLKLPRARVEGLLAERVDGDLVIYDELSKRAHCLSPEAALVWDHCDGSASQLEVARRLRMRPQLVAQAVQELRGAGLIVEAGITRRDAAKRGAALGALAMTASGGTLLTTMAVPAAAAACSQPNNGCCTGLAPTCGWPESQLETMSSYGLFAMTGSTVGINLATVDGNVGVASGAKLTAQSLTLKPTSSVPNPHVFVDPGGTYTQKGGAPAGVSQDESAIQAAALQASSVASSAGSCAGVTTFALGNVSSNKSVAPTPLPSSATLYVVTIDNWTSGNITLTGNAFTFFVVNVSGDINLGGSSSLIASGVPITNVLVNQTGTGVTLNTMVGNVIDATLISLHGSGAQYEGTLGSSFLGGNEPAIMSGAEVRSTICPCRCP